MLSARLNIEMKVVGIVSSVLDDEESPREWLELLGGSEYAKVITKDELENVNEAALLEECSSLLVCGLEPIERFKNEMASLEGGRDVNLAEDIDIDAIAAELARTFASSGENHNETNRSNGSHNNDASLNGLNRLIAAFFYNQGNTKPVVGIGHGAIQVCRVVGGNTIIRPTARLRLECLRETASAVLTMLGYDPSPQESLTIPIISFAEFETLPPDATIVASGSDNTIIVANIKNKALLICGHPEQPAESLLERWLPILDDNLALSAAEAEKTIGSLQESSSLLPQSKAFFCNIVGQFLIGKQANDLVRRVQTLEARVGELERENSILRGELLSQHLNLSTTRDDSNISAKLSSDAQRIRSILAGAGAHGTLLDIERVESDLLDLNIKPQVCFEEAVEISSGNAPIVSMVATTTGLVVFGTTDKRLQTSEGESILLDAPPIILASRPLAIPTRIACGTLSGSIEVFTQSSDGKLFNDRITLKNSPHKKHICGLAWDPLGTGRLASASKDGQLCFWSEDMTFTEAKLGFHADRPPECICAVVIEGKSFVAVGKRNDNIIVLVPFDSPQDLGSHVSLKMDPTLAHGEAPFMAPLAMTSLKDIPLLIVATDKSKIVVYDLLTKKKCREFHGHVCGEFARPGLAWSDSGDWLAVTSDPSQVFAFRVSRPDERPAVLTEHNAVVRCVCFGADSVDGKPCLYSAGMDKRVYCRPMLGT